MKSHLQTLSWEAQPQVDLALVCNPKGQRSHEFPPDHTLRNFLNLVMDSIFAYGIDRPVYWDPCAPRDCVAAMQRFQGGILGKSQTSF